MQTILIEKKCLTCKKMKPRSEFIRFSYAKNFISEEREFKTCNVCSEQIKKWNNEKQYDKKRYHKDKTKYFERNKKRNSLRPRYAWSVSSLQSHRVRGFKNEVTPTELELLANSTTNCGICGCELDWGKKGKKKSNSPTIDRINNEKILTVDNIMIVCSYCNVAKSTKTLTEFIEYCRNIVRRYP